MLIGCIALVRNINGQLLGIDCNKGRGKILPGGKWEQGKETFAECALRELREETGMIGENPRLIFQAPDGFGFHVFAFEVTVDFKGYKQPYSEGEMWAHPVTWEELKRSKYAAYYELLEQVVNDATSK